MIVKSDYNKVFACIVFSKVESTSGMKFIANGKQYNHRKGIGNS